MTDKGPEICHLAKLNKVRYTKHAIERIREYGLTVLQVNAMLKNCKHNPKKDDVIGHRVEGRVPATETTGTKNISAHVKISEAILVITVINH